MSAAPPIPLSSSVSSLKKEFGDQHPTATGIALSLLRSHPKYGQGPGRKLLEEFENKGETHPLPQWIDQVSALYKPEVVLELHGRLVILGLCIIDSEAWILLARMGFLQRIVNELKEDFHDLLNINLVENYSSQNEGITVPFDLGRWLDPSTKEPKEPKTKEDDLESDISPESTVARGEAVRLYLDNPAESDELDREILAEAIYDHIARIWGLKKEDESEVSTPVQQAFTMYIHGEWGVGKSSILNLLEKKLQSQDKKEDRWVVSWFNAWQHQHVDPPWWSLMDTLFRSIVSQLADSDKIDASGRAWKIKIREFWFRTLARISPTFLTVGVLVLLASGLWLFRASLLNVFGAGTETPSPKGDFGDLIKDIGAALALIVTLAGFFFNVSQSLLSGSGKAASEYMKEGRDPMRRIKMHFNKLIGRAKNPVAVFIDDLDRCHDQYCVQLLEGMQTLFKDSRVLFVVAADRRWISTCFENVYKEFRSTVHKPGNRLGYLFVEKAFQMSVKVPAIAPETQNRYWKNLLEVKDDSPETAVQEEKDINEMFASKDNEHSVLETLGEIKSKGLNYELAKKVAVKKIGSKEILQQTEHSLQQFVLLLDPNPRAMKRLINFYSIFRQQKIVEGLIHELSLSHIARWLIFSTRFPVWAEYLEDTPEDVEYVLGNKKMIKKEKDSRSLEFRQMLDSRDAAKILKGDPEDWLTPKIIGYCVGARG